MLCSFTVGFHKVLKSCLFISHGFVQFNWYSFAQWHLLASLKVPWSIIEDKGSYLVQNLLPPHNTAELNSGIPFAYFTQEKSLQIKETNTHTNHTQYTHISSRYHFSQIFSFFASSFQTVIFCENCG